jgi:hypothetical protein
MIIQKTANRPLLLFLPLNLHLMARIVDNTIVHDIISHTPDRDMEARSHPIWPFPFPLMEQKSRQTRRSNLQISKRKMIFDSQGRVKCVFSEAANTRG